MNNHEIRVGGVPEHFNIPWHMAKELHSLPISWIDYKSGSGAMAQALRNKELDMAVLLTEAAIAEVNIHNDSVLLSTYTDSPLIWGIHTGMHNSLQEISGEVYRKKIAISRKGSGSHLMAILDAHKAGIDNEALHWVTVTNLDGAIRSLESLESDIFYWERYTTLPYVHKGLLRCIGESPTPWPAFTIVANKEWMLENQHTAKHILQTLRHCAIQFKNNKEESLARVATTFDLHGAEAETWWQQTHWSKSNNLTPELYLQVSQALINAGILHTIKEFTEISVPL